MKTEITYGSSPLYVEADSITTVLPNDVEKRDEKAVLNESLDHPVDSDPLSLFMKDPFLLVVNDAQRPTPTARILTILLERASHSNFEIAVATGSHSPPGTQELAQIFGDHYPSLKKKIYIHRALDSPHTYYGTTSQGVEIYFDEILKKYEKIITIGSVEPHYFAGLTGGRKSFLPGLAAYKTIEQNHKFAMEKEAQNLALEGNPVHECMEEAARLIPKDIFCINVVLDRHRNIYACSSGDIFASFYQAAEWGRKVYCVATEPHDVVIAVASPPLDINLYQAQKAIESGKLALNDDGILIFVAQCKNGIGPDKFYQLLKKCKTPDEALQTLKKGYELGYHKAGKIAELANRAHIWAVTDLESAVLKDVFMNPYPSIQKAADDALEIKDGSLLVLPEASITVPMCDVKKPL